MLLVKLKGQCSSIEQAAGWLNWVHHLSCMPKEVPARRSSLMLYSLQTRETQTLVQLAKSVCQLLLCVCACVCVLCEYITKTWSIYFCLHNVCVLFDSFHSSLIYKSLFSLIIKSLHLMSISKDGLYKCRNKYNMCTQLCKYTPDKIYIYSGDRITS